MVKLNEISYTVNNNFYRLRTYRFKLSVSITRNIIVNYVVYNFIFEINIDFWHFFEQV